MKPNRHRARDITGLAEHFEKVLEKHHPGQTADFPDVDDEPPYDGEEYPELLGPSE